MIVVVISQIIYGVVITKRTDEYVQAEQHYLDNIWQNRRNESQQPKFSELEKFVSIPIKPTIFFNH